MDTTKTIGGTDANGFAINVPYTGNPNIPVNYIAPATPIPVTAPQYKDYSSAIAGNASYTQSAFDTQQANVDALNSQAQARNTDLATLTSQLGGRGADTNLAMQQTGATNLAAEIRKLNAQSAALAMDTQAKTLAEQNKATGQNITSQAVQRNTADATRENFINQANIAMQVAIKTADYNTAKDLADQIVNAKYDQLEADLKAKQINLQGLKDYSLTPAEKKLANTQTLLLKQQEQVLADQKETEKGIQNVGLTLRKYGVDDTVVQNVLNSKTLNEAIIKAGNNLQDPQAKLELQKLWGDIQLNKMQMAKEQYNLDLLQKYGTSDPKEIKASKDALMNAKTSYAETKAQADAIEALKTDAGLPTRVGTSLYSRTPQGFFGALGKSLLPGSNLAPDLQAKISGSGQNFSAAVHNLVSGLTLKALIDAKAKGATFGALSEGELNILANSASKINDWEIKDSKGNGTGVWNVDEASFVNELNRIQGLYKKALIQSGGGIISPDESSQLNQIFPQSVEPSNYYGI